MRYQIVYMKRGFPLTTWANSADRAGLLSGAGVRCGRCGRRCVAAALSYIAM